MLPFVDMHCHLLAGLDDGPGTEDDATAMCRLAYAEGTRWVAATAHQNDRWASVTPDRIRQATRRLAGRLREAEVPLTVLPCAEVMVDPETEDSWIQGRLLSIADRRQYLLIEPPHGFFLDLQNVVRALRRHGIRPVLAHPERQPELLHEPARVEELIRAGCLVQVSSGSVTRPRCREDALALKGWFRRGLVHLLGSDGHDTTRRPPGLADAYRQIVSWAGVRMADRVTSTIGLAVLQGLPIHLPEPEPRGRWWAGLLSGALGW
jgi:protein-tyrosine phosphatase